MTILDQLRAGIATASAQESQAVAEAFAATLPADITLALHGDLGVGKTTFVQGLARAFRIQEAITSPTFNIYSVHRGPARTLVHLDAYRLNSAAEIENLL
ncbi:MAG TPA: tRNA (adenosine(37)-N6)-threonylcarbamoyltransferase complex ATPase subunit type 1 TsaE, partial [Opitutus sp.]|nr:tRNA (adenosine(37)-N6)-threonylcarbamoyltransferase complex ATPase subunit type 1 TsaE [Opitutus sp.]